MIDRVVGYPVFVAVHTSYSSIFPITCVDRFECWIMTEVAVDLRPSSAIDGS